MTTTAPAADLSSIYVVANATVRTEGTKRELGEVLFTQNWPRGRADKMVGTRALVPAPYTLLETLKPCACGRMWVDEGAAARHKCVRADV